MKKFLMYLLALALSLALLGSGIFYIWFPEIPVYIYLLEVLFFVVLGFSTHYFTHKSTEKKPQTFVTYYLGVTTIRLFCSMFFALIFGFVYRDYVVQVLLSFLVLYLAFFVLETTMLYQDTKRTSSAKSPENGQ